MPLHSKNAALLLDQFRHGRLRALSQIISLAEDQDVEAANLLAELYSQVGQARVIGLTGPPGSGKSSLANDFVRRFRSQSQKAAVIAVDPVSPFTGGALLGDRIRLVEHFNDPGVFIRSLSTRGKLGGLSLATRAAVHACDAFGFPRVVVETVGVGQSEVDIQRVAELTIVVLVPEWGDGIQALKAGVLEIGDLFVVNKADREGADRVVKELKNALALSGKSETSVLTTSIHDEASLGRLFEAANLFFESAADLVRQRRQAAVKRTMLDLLESRVMAEAREWVQRQDMSGGNPYRAILELEKVKPFGSLFSG